MTELRNKNLIRKILSNIPILLLFISVLNNFDFNHLGLKYFSFNFSYILIFYYSLKKSESLGYTYIFIAGLFNDVVTGTPMGLSSLMYLILCVAASYLRNITLRPSLINDCIFFLITILIINSLMFVSLNFIFNYELNYFDQIINITYTFLFYFLFSNLFDFFEKYLVGRNNAR
ncbi:rod shape-determining protein MreD [Candidatus Pelagibacter sp.]|jgi:rod shape-determining protein MreD|nr:rod shape-determining protein MreD [Candidatus Pelagibacter sp.]MDB9987593.1 rod shape-determining protein MreD [Candidatus Pelagibacter sp.]|tara:strand:- start:43 stop:564 length:522 start_codon:yes stop_codon:yes gene_type:complete